MRFFSLRVNRSWLGLFASVFLLLGALSIIRFGAVQILQVNLSRAYQLGLLNGFLQDVSFSLLVFALALGASSLNKRVGVAVAGILAFVLTFLGAANFSCFDFFGAQLTLAMLQYGEDLAHAKENIYSYLRNPVIVSSFLCGIFSVICFSKGINRLNLKATTRAASAAVIVVLALFVRQSPTWFRIQAVTDSILSDQIVLRFWWNAFEKTELNPARTAEASYYREHAQGWLASYKYSDRNTIQLDLNRRIREPSALTLDQIKRLRADFGLPENQKPNVIVIALESLRAFEFFDPVLGPQIFPRLKKIFSEHGILFSQAYSAASFTAQGLFNIDCSNFDRGDGMNVYNNHPYIKADCLAGVLKRNGYSTNWFHTYHKQFQNMLIFDQFHGYDHFYDSEYFDSKLKGDSAERTNWGIGDRPFLKESIRKIDELFKNSQEPFYARVLTAGTHSPWPEMSKGFVPSAMLMKVTEKNGSYQRFLSNLMALDAGLGDFFDELFKSPLGENTLVVLSADHGVGVRPPQVELNDAQKSLIASRILAGVVSKNLKKPRVVSEPVNQIDLAPLVGDVVGVKEPLSWVGQNPLTTPGGSMWVEKKNTRIFYRTRTRLCMVLPQEVRTKCWAFAAQVDPLFSKQYKPVDEDPNLTDQLSKVYKSNAYLIEHNQI